MLVIVLIVIVIPLSCQYIEEPYRYYDTYTKELHNGLWTPEIFPKDIRDIHEQHDIDTNRAWLRFTLGEQILDLVTYVKADKTVIQFTKPFLVSWWLSELPDHYVFYHGSRANDSLSTLAILISSKVVYWWC
jgi:hypothetical protein